jgi:hypothetical protein
MPERPGSIFVLGKHRSGTTGLANHLCEHPNIAGVQHEQHWGIHESGFFTYVEGRYGTLSHWPTYREFVEVMSASDYFRLTEIGKEYMLSLWPTTYAGFFGAVMREHARRQKSRFWIEKSPSHTKKALSLAKEYPEARFVAIIRDVSDVVASSLSHHDGREEPDPEGAERLLMVVRILLGWVYYNKSIYALKEYYPCRTKVIKFEKFVGDKEEVLRGVCNFLGVEFRSGMCTLPYSRNSSFSNKKKREKAMSEVEKRYTRQLASILTKVPYGGYNALNYLYDRLRTKPDLPKWFFRLSDQESGVSATSRKSES